MGTGAGGAEHGFVGPPVKAKQYVAYDSEQQVLPAGKRAMLELRFVVLPGFHVNSHRPKSELLLPTKVELGAEAGVKLAEAEYPAGTSFSFAFDPSDKLDVYAETLWCACLLRPRWGSMS